MRLEDVIDIVFDNDNADLEDILDLLSALPKTGIVRCKDCESWQTDWKPKGCEHEDAHFCEMIGRVVCADHYCGYAERKKDK